MLTVQKPAKANNCSLKTSIACAAMAVLGASAAAAAPIPAPVADMIDAAAGDPAQLKVIADIARKTNPDSIAEIDAKIARITSAAAEAKQTKLASQSLLQGWSGSGEIGAFASSGNTNNTGVVVGVKLAKETRRWKHSLNGIVDYQRQSGVTSKERYLAGYEGHYKISPRFYALLTLAYDRDKFSGFNSRFAESLGLGYKIIDTANFKLSGEAGPALRQTHFTNGVRDNAITARGAGNLWWQIRPGIAFTEDASAFYGSFNTSFQSLTALTAKLNGALSARASFQVNTESNPPLGRRKSDTTSRLSLVYGF